jgi:uncharacterized protein (TIGR02145 family)
MKRIFTLIALLIIGLMLKGQAPAGFTYQALLKDAAGTIKPNTATIVKFEILQASATGTVAYSETHNTTTTSSGLINLSLGTGTPVTGTFSSIDWSTGTYFLKISIDGTVMGATQLLSVPYALYSTKAGNGFSGNYTDLTNKPDLTVGAVKKLTVSGETTDMEEALFEVKNKNGQTVFAVYNEGVRIYVDNGSAKGSKGGFAIGGFSGAKASTQNYFVVSSDSIRAYIDTNTGKASKGGFAIGGFGNSKGTGEEYLRVTRDSTRVYINNSLSKASKGGFAIGGFGGAKGIANDYLLINPQSTNFYVRSQGSNSLSTFNILSVNENLLQKPLMSADADTITMKSFLSVLNDMNVTGDIGYTGDVTKITIPVISAEQVINVTQTTALAGGIIISNGGGAIIASGVCWSESVIPTIDLGTKTTDGSANGSFTSTITGLTAATTYFVRAYATNSIGTGYSEEVIFTTNSSAPVLATLTTATPGAITAVSALGGGNITDNGGAQITVGGVCWSTSPGPLVTDSHTVEPYPQGTFVSSITGLTDNTTYYVRAYATNVIGTSYGDEVSFTTPPPPVTVTDIDGNIYNTVMIGAQTWISSNLKTTRLNDGTSIPNVTDGTAWSQLGTPGYSWYNNDNATNGEYGILYNWQTVSTGLLCPAGWQVPTESDLMNMSTTLGGYLVAGGKLKEAGTLHWNAPNTGATDEVGFKALGGGFRNYMGTFFNIGGMSNWWTSSMISVDPTFFGMDANSAEVMISMMFDKSGMYVRCIKPN